MAPHTYNWDGPDADFGPESDDLPWALVPERKLAAEDVKAILSSHYQGTDYDPYKSHDTGKRGMYRSIGINRTGVTAICQIRSGVPDTIKGVEWICYGSTTFAAMVPVYTNVSKLPAYLSKVTADTSTEDFYWGSRLIGALADPCYADCMQHIDRYHNAVANESRRLLLEYDKKIAAAKKADGEALREEANEALCKMAKEQTIDTLNKVLLTASEHMKNGYKLSDN